MRAVIGDHAYLGMMFGGVPAEAAYLWVEDEGDYSKPWMDGLDLVATTSGPGEVECTSLANKASYMLRAPDFSTCTPDHLGPFILQPSSRGERGYLDIEWDTYGTVRDPYQWLKPTIDAQRARIKATGYKGCG